MNVEVQEIADTVWDAVVIGAGPAGSVVAHQLATFGQSVLLVDRSVFPRRKVCGGCLSGAGVDSLRAAGLGHVLDQLDAPPLRLSRLVHRGRVARIPLRGGVAVSRLALDLALATAAATAGAIWLQGVHGAVMGQRGDRRIDAREVALTPRGNRGARSVVRGRVVIDATGLAQGESRKHFSKSRPHVGLGAVAAKELLALPAGEVLMLCGEHGYLGVCAVEDGSLHLAAAVEASWLREVGGPCAAIEALRRQSGACVPELGNLTWKGTSQLATQPAIATSPRCLTIGDASGAVAPFTGEGMGNAVQSAWVAAPIAAGIARSRSTEERTSFEQRWCRELSRLRRGQRTNRTIAWLLRTPWAMRSAHRLLRVAPEVAVPVVARIGRAQSVRTQFARAQFARTQIGNGAR